MPFNSKTASLAGKKSKRKKEHGNDELRFELLEFSKDLIQELKKKELDDDQKLKLLQITLSYSMPKLKTTEVHGMHFNNRYQPLSIELTPKNNEN